MDEAGATRILGKGRGSGRGRHSVSGIAERGAGGRCEALASPSPFPSPASLCRLQAAPQGCCEPSGVTQRVLQMMLEGLQSGGRLDAREAFGAFGPEYLCTQTLQRPRRNPELPQVSFRPKGTFHLVIECFNIFSRKKNLENF